MIGLSSDSERLLLPGRREVRLPCADFAIRRGSDHLGFFLLWLLGFAVASLLALGHDVLLDLRFEPVRSGWHATITLGSFDRPSPVRQLDFRRRWRHRL